MNFKLIIGTCLLICAYATAQGKVRFDNSFNNADWRDHVVFKHFNFQYSPQKTAQADGSILRYSKKIHTEDSEDSYFVVIEYPDEGFYHGLSKADTDNTMIPLYGVLDEGKEKLLPVMGYTPKQWKKAGNQKPDFKDEKTTYIPATPFSRDYSVSKVMQFQPTGVVTFTVSTNYTTYAPQELAGEYTTYQKKGGRMRPKNTRQLTGGWYFDIKGKVTISGRWKVTGDSLRMTFSKPVTNVTASYNEQALIDEWKQECAVRYLPFELDTYRRQYMAQARADYPNHKVTEEKNTVKELLEEQLSNEGFSAGVTFNFKLYGMNKNEIMLRTSKHPIIFSCNRGARYFATKEFYEIFPAFIKMDNEITADEMKCRQLRIEEQIFSTDCPVIRNRTDDGVLCAYNIENNTATYYVTSRNDNGTIEMYESELPFEIDRTNFNKEKFAENFRLKTDLDEVVNEFNENETKLNDIVNNKKSDKKDQKLAKKYFSDTKKMVRPTTVFRDYTSYMDAVNSWKERIAFQKKYLAPGQ